MTELRRLRPRSSQVFETSQSYLSITLSPVIFAQASAASLRQRRRTGQMSAFENYLALVSSMYYGGISACHLLEGSGRRRRKGRGLKTISILLSPLRKDYAFERWSPYEVAVFETGLCTFGKQFKKIEKMLKDKSYSEITQFYYKWKQTSHYQAWKTAFMQVSN